MFEIDFKNQKKDGCFPCVSVQRVFDRPSRKEKDVVWVPYGMHCMAIGLEDTNDSLYVPMCTDSLLQSMRQ